MPNTVTKTSAATVTGALGKAADWLRTRYYNIDIFDEHYQAEARGNPFYALGSIFFLLWVLVMATGLVLIMWYVPTKAGAYNSILDIQNHIPFGSLIRGMHKYGADAMIIAATMRLYRMFLASDYKPGREFNIAIGLVTLLLSMYSGLTGYLLIWNQRAYWATKVFATFPTYMDQFPFIGDFYQPLVKSLHIGWNTSELLLGGGAAITQETITRFFSLHVAFSLVPLILVELYFYRTGYHRINLNWTKRVIVILLVGFTAIILPAAIGARSNPEVTPLPILSDWYFLGLYQMYKYLEPVVATEITLLIPLTVIFLPFIDVSITGPEKQITKRPLVLMTTIMGLVNWLVFSMLIIVGIANIHSDPPYWRDFVFLMVDLGAIWQLILIWKNTNVRQHLQNTRACLVMGMLAFLQTILAIIYYTMARTEMFFSLVIQSFVYWLCKPFMGSAGQAENIVRNLFTVNPDYWHYQYLLASGGIKGKILLDKLNQLCQISTPVDWLFRCIPSFTATPASTLNALHANHITQVSDLYAIAAYPLENAQYGIVNLPWYRYHGLIDYMVTNQWCQDYVRFCDRINGVISCFNQSSLSNSSLTSSSLTSSSLTSTLATNTLATSPYFSGAPVPTYPMPVPQADWAWMAGGAITMVLCFATAIFLKLRRQAEAKPASSTSASKAAKPDA